VLNEVAGAALRSRPSAASAVGAASDAAEKAAALTLAAASIYHQLMALPDLATHGVYYIGANGKIGSAVVQRLVKHGVKVRTCSHGPSSFPLSHT
jgi:NADPH:quinone reductase-like Zn-dependent oxidoreductase